MPVMITGQRVACTLCGNATHSDEIVAGFNCLACPECETIAPQGIRAGAIIPQRNLLWFAFSALSPEGKTITDQVTAASAAAARDLLLYQGHRSVVLHEDDIFAKQFQLSHQTTGSKPSRRYDLTPRERIRLARSRSIWPPLLLNLRKTWTWWGGALLLILLDRPVSGAVFLGIYVLLMGWLMVPLAMYQPLIRAVEGARWDEVLRVAARIRRLSRIMPGKVSEHELAFREAQAHAIAGQLDKALAMMAPFEHDRNVERWMYCNWLTVLHGLAGDVQGQIHWSERTVEEAPDNFGGVIDLAILKARKEHDPETARQLRDRAHELPAIDLVSHAIPFCQGLIALEEGPEPGGSRIPA